MHWCLYLFCDHTFSTCILKPLILKVSTVSTEPFSASKFYCGQSESGLAVPLDHEPPTTKATTPSTPIKYRLMESLYFLHKNDAKTQFFVTLRVCQTFAVD
jgi:hypothetical protein